LSFYGQILTPGPKIFRLFRTSIFLTQYIFLIKPSKNMQKFVLKLASMGLVATALFFSACGDDPIITNPLGPVAELVADTDVLTADAELQVGETFKVALKLSTGDAQLQSLSIDVGSDKLATDRFVIDGGAITSNNPLLITGADKDGVTYIITISPAADQMVGDVDLYAFTVTDENGETASTDIQITTAAPATTPLEMTLSGVLLNQAGPVGTGGLDLDNGNGTGSADAASEIRDLGIDCTINPMNAENWRAQIGTINGANMVKVDPSQIEGFNFDNVADKETVLAAYDTGATLADGASQAVDCTETTVTDVSDPVAVGDIFAVFANSTYYLLRVDEVNPVSGSNSDNIVFTIKY
jgi:hypothetical protein